jgi:hypothetical protein
MAHTQARPAARGHLKQLRSHRSGRAGELRPVHSAPGSGGFGSSESWRRTCRCTTSRRRCACEENSILRRFLYDEPFHADTVLLLHQHGLSPRFLKSLPTASGPLYSFVQFVFEPLTHLQTVRMRLVNVFLLALVSGILVSSLKTQRQTDHWVAGCSPDLVGRLFRQRGCFVLCYYRPSIWCVLFGAFGEAVDGAARLQSACRALLRRRACLRGGAPTSA